MIPGSDKRMQLQGSLTMRTVGKLYAGGLQPQNAASLVVDLSQVAEVDSSAVSLMLSWLREAQRNNVNLCFFHVPDNLLSLARLYGVAEILPLCPAE